MPSWWISSGVIFVVVEARTALRNGDSKAASEKLPRRGRTTVAGTINDHGFQATLEPDGQLSHWLRLEQALLAHAGVNVGEVATLGIDWLLSAVSTLARGDRWHSLARLALRDLR